MRDPRLQVFAKNIINYSVNLLPGENVLIDFIGIKDPELLKCFLEEASKAGGNSFVEIRDPAVTRSIMMNGTEENFRKMADIELYRMKQMNAYIAVRGGENVSETADVPESQMKLYSKYYQRPVTDYRVDNTDRKSVV
jgi:aminopeptidase